MADKTDPTIDLKTHDIAYKRTFLEQWKDYWALRPTVVPPNTPGQMVKFLRQCYQVPRSEVGYEVWDGRFPFRHPEMRDALLYVVLEGVTEHTPVGTATFLGIRQTRHKSPYEFSRGVQYRVPPDQLTVGDQAKWIAAEISRCREWLRRSAPDNPNNAATEATLHKYMEMHERLIPRAASVADLQEQVAKLTKQLAAMTKQQPEG